MEPMGYVIAIQVLILAFIAALGWAAGRAEKHDPKNDKTPR